MLNLIISFILMYLVNELAKNYLKSLFFNFFNVFSSLGLIWVVTMATHLNFCQLFFFDMKHFSKYYRKVSNSESLSYIVIKQ